MDKRVIFLSAARQIKLTLLLIALFAGLSGCATSGSTAADGEGSQPAERSEVEMHLATAQRLIDIGEYQSALQEYLQAAEVSDDPDVARTVTRLAGRLEAWPEAVSAAERWLALDEDADAAYHVKVIGLVNQARVAPAEETLRDWLGRADDSAEHRWWRRSAMLLSAANAQETARAVFDRLRRAEGSAAPAGEVDHALSILLWRQGQRELAYERALAAADESGEVDHLVWTAQLAVDNDNLEQALSLYRRARERDPEDVSLALSEAEVLRQLERNDAALSLLEGLPPGSDALYTLGIYQAQLERKEAARATWQRLRDLPEDEQRADHDFLAAQLAELVGLDEAALAAYQRVEDPARAQEARLREAIVTGRLGRVEAARELLQTLRSEGNDALTLETWLIEAEVLRNAGRPGEAVALLGEPLARNPSSTDLLYARALNAAAAENIDLAEQDLRRIIQMDGGNSMALNALGYTLTDLTDRHQEAYRLIQRALELDPDDPATLDSMGWVLYRLDRAEEAVDYLRRALEGDENAEIMAHLIEVLDHLGEDEEADALAERALESFPDDPLLLSTLERLGRRS